MHVSDDHFLHKMVKWLVTIFFFQPIITEAQFSVVDSLCIKNGLPFNYVYLSYQDRNGFLWVSTDAGLSKFDGKRFKHYGIKDGLPNNEIIQFLEDKGGQLWIRSSNGKIAYFSNYQNRFLRPESDLISLSKDRISELLLFSDGSMRIRGQKEVYFLKDNYLKSYPVSMSSDSSLVVVSFSDGSTLRYSLSGNQSPQVLNIYAIGGNNSNQKIETGLHADYVGIDPNDTSLYLFKIESNELVRLSNFKATPVSFITERVILKHPCFYYNFTPEYLCIHHRYSVDTNGYMLIDVYDRHTLKHLATLDNQMTAQHLLRDKNHNLWVSTHQHGLYKFSSKKQIRSLFTDLSKSRTFFSLANSKDGYMLTGGENNEILELENERIRKRYWVANKNREWQKKIIATQNKVYCFSDGGVFINYNHEVRFRGQTLTCKVVERINDSLILIGNKNGLFSLNTVCNEISQISSKYNNISSFAILNGNHVLLGTESGLYQLYIKQGTIEKVFLKDSLPIDLSISSISITPENLIWVATLGEGILVMRGGKLIARIKVENGLPNNVVNLVCRGKAQQLWCSSYSGISRIDYRYKKGELSYHIQNVSAIDGLSSTAVHAMLYRSDTLWAATDNGINAIPDSVFVPDIPIVLTRLQINQQDTPFNNQYHLPFNQNNILIEFSGVDINRYFSHAQLSRDEGNTWANIDESSLRLELQPGKHSIWLRAVDVNKHISQQIRKLNFYIDAPWYQTIWFQVVISMLIILITSLIARVILVRHRKRIELIRELELARHQTFSASINPHFIFNALNSIQHYLNVNDRIHANKYLGGFARLIRKNFNATKKLEIRLADEIETLEMYLNLESLRQPGNYTYEILIDESLDTEEIELPVMILQPFVENAIKHGFGKSLIPGKLLISFSKIPDKILEINIQDNGIGLINSRSDNAAHQSSGEEITRQRLELYARIKGIPLEFYTEAVNPADLQNPGQRVCIRLGIL